jgi:aspartyl-tRNA(Asn)/glutamyl-tRNA(Gln) amidotransferase subunit A
VINESDLAGLRKLAGSLGDRMSPHLADALRAEWTAEQLTSAVMGRKAVYNAAWRFFRSYDLLLTPTLAVPPFEHGIQGPTEIGGRTVEPFYWLSFTFPFNLTGQPAATVPAGWTADGLPVGLQIAGAASTTPRSCARPRPTKPPRRGTTGGHPCSPRWACKPPTAAL